MTKMSAPVATAHADTGCPGNLYLLAVGSRSQEGLLLTGESPQGQSMFNAQHAGSPRGFLLSPEMSPFPTTSVIQG